MKYYYRPKHTGRFAASIAGFGILLMIFSIMMIINPDSWSKGIISFSNKPISTHSKLFLELGLE